jgi:hypothetical protein
MRYSGMHMLVVLALFNSFYCNAMSMQGIYDRIKMSLRNGLFVKRKHDRSPMSPEDKKDVAVLQKKSRDRNNPNDLDAAILQQAALTVGFDNDTAISLRPDQHEKMTDILKKFPQINPCPENPAVVYQAMLDDEKNNRSYFKDDISITRLRFLYANDGYIRRAVHGPVMRVESVIQVLKKEDAPYDKVHHNLNVYNKDLADLYTLQISPCTKCRAFNSSGLLGCITEINVDPGIKILKHFAKTRKAS